GLGKIRRGEAAGPRGAGRAAAIDQLPEGVQEPIGETADRRFGVDAGAVFETQLQPAGEEVGVDAEQMPAARPRAALGAGGFFSGPEHCVLTTQGTELPEVVEDHLRLRQRTSGRPPELLL